MTVRRHADACICTYYPCRVRVLHKKTFTFRQPVELVKLYPVLECPELGKLCPSA